MAGARTTRRGGEDSASRSPLAPPFHATTPAGRPLRSHVAGRSGSHPLVLARAAWGAKGGVRADAPHADRGYASGGRGGTALYRNEV